MYIYKKDYYGFVYLWFDKKRDKLCVGSHMGSTEDGYTTSTGHCKHAIKKRPETFERVILYRHPIDNRKTLLEVEQLFLDAIPRDLFGNYFYNRKPFASGGGVIGAKRSVESNLKRSIAQKGKKRNQIYNTSGLIEAKKVKIECEFCKRFFDYGNYAKFHGENCKLNPDVDPEVIAKRSIHAKKAAAASVASRKSK